MDRARKNRERQDAIRRGRDDFLAEWKRRKVIPFEEFMAAALFHQDFGYYSVRAQDVGAQGDFSTSATLSSDLGKAVAHWLVAESTRIFRWQWNIHIVEVGAGNGALAESVLRALPLHISVRTKYHIVEKSSPLRDKQQETLRPLTRFPGPRILWHIDMDSVLKMTNSFCLFSNELVDAFPASVFRWNSPEPQSQSLKNYPDPIPPPAESSTQGHWKKLFLRLESDQLFEEWHQISRHELQSITSIAEPSGWNGHGPRQNQRCEVHFSFREWLHAWVPRVRSLSMLTIDYGDLFPYLYKHHPAGTLRSYFRHNRFTGNDIYKNIGAQDITCDVNFTDLKLWGQELDLHSEPVINQSQFFHSRVPSHNPDPANPESQATEFLTNPAGAGHAFKVLIQRK